MLDKGIELINEKNPKNQVLHDGSIAGEYIGREIVKMFKDPDNPNVKKPYQGDITNVDISQNQRPLFHIEYNYGDSEDMYEDEMLKCLLDKEGHTHITTLLTLKATQQSHNNHPTSFCDVGQAIAYACKYGDEDEVVK